MADGAYTTEDLTAAIAETAKMLSIPIRPPRWVQPSWWCKPLNETRTRPIPANSGWITYIEIKLGITPGFAPNGYSIKLCAYVGTTENDPLVNGVTYRFRRNGALLPAQEFGITNTIERHLERYTNPEPFPAFGRKMFLHVPNNGTLFLQVNNPSGATQLAFAALYGYYYPNLGDIGRGGLENPVVGGWGPEDSARD